MHLYESRLYEYMETKGRDVLEAIRDTGELKRKRKCAEGVAVCIYGRIQCVNRKI